MATLQHRRHWTDDLQVNSRGVVLGNLRNAFHVLRHAPEWHGVLAYDDFAAKVITRKPPPWSDRNVDRWSNDDDVHASVWFQEHAIPVTVGGVGRAIATVSHENPIHPVRDYLNGLRWDQRPRIDTWLTTYFGVADSRYVRAVGSRFLISAVARIVQPGCQVDHMLILEGPQGIQKSSGLRELARPWFTDRLSRVGSKDSAMEVNGVWLIEISELDAFSKAGNSAIKSFVTRQHDRFRPPYGKHVEERPRQSVFAGTINPAGGYLKDPTGARRFWPVSCGSIDLDLLRRDRDQLWAEAVVRFQRGDPWHLETPELETLASVEQEARYQTDPWEEKIGPWLVGRNDVSVAEVLTGAIGLAPSSWSHSVEIRTSNILKRLGFSHWRPGKVGQPRTPRYRRERLKLKKIA